MGIIRTPHGLCGSFAIIKQLVGQGKISCRGCTHQNGAEEMDVRNGNISIDDKINMCFKRVMIAISS